jgi:hypothetical protein
MCQLEGVVIFTVNRTGIFLKRLVPERVKEFFWRSRSEPLHAKHLQKSTAYYDIGQKSDQLKRFFEPLHDVPGWFNVDDFGHFLLVLRMQSLSGLKGDLLEIGSYHGRSSAVMSTLLAEDERLIICDAFDLVTDDNYSGDFAIPTPEGVRENIKRVSPAFDMNRVDIIRCLSSDLGSRLSPGQKFRFVHIDGGHSVEQTFKDLELAHALLVTGGVVVVDDYHNADWPTVTEGTDMYLKTRTGLSVLADLNRHGALGRKLYLVKAL